MQAARRRCHHVRQTRDHLVEQGVLEPIKGVTVVIHEYLWVEDQLGVQNECVVDVVAVVRVVLLGGA